MCNTKFNTQELRIFLTDYIFIFRVAPRMNTDHAVYSTKQEVTF